MALQDLTPQLRTRLSHMERAVGWFVLLATALLVFGFAYYVYNTAKRKGWFLTKAPYFTFTDRATGLKVGDPVMLMGFEVGQITRIDAQPPEDFYFNVYVEFEIKEPYHDYMWTVGSRAKVATADFLGKRVVEVTKGTGGCPTYKFNPLREMSLDEAQNLVNPEAWQLAEDVYVENETGLELAVPALTPLVRTNLAKLRALGKSRILAFDTREKYKFMTAVWDDKKGSYVKFIPQSDPAANVKANLYWLPSDESPAVTERLEKLVDQVQQALPNFFALTNHIVGVLSNTASLTSNLNALATDARPAATNLAYISSQLREPGSLGAWMLGTNANRQISSTLENANTAITRADTNLVAIVENLARSLDNLADITSNLNAQVQANTNILGSISKAVVDADELVQGLKRHWLLRSAFRNRAIPPGETPPKDSTLPSPKAREQFPR
jgi:ABC-type transporter Mla subunit MlaD